MRKFHGVVLTGISFWTLLKRRNVNNLCTARISSEQRGLGHCLSSSWSLFSDPSLFSGQRRSRAEVMDDPRPLSSLFGGVSTDLEGVALLADKWETIGVRI
ncbi:hypothetical protein AVEN_32765-1 [Araneus ventricosus]|uniref:Uncharacterized protein n=1 Tax=Araneus ventricosus TaxID=182803 RepID=A0A4Y2CVU1_ARAVE|nr:hypothetical protein AVEN_32765-1 [Araneus ventricosus]